MTDGRTDRRTDGRCDFNMPPEVPSGALKEADRRRGGKTISKSGQEWTLPAQLGQLKTGQHGKGLLQIHPWCPDDLPRLWDRIKE